MQFAPHTHTDKSDGEKSPADAVQQALQIGFSKYAITDHETIDAFSDPALESFMRVAGNNFIELIPGVELTTIGGIPDAPKKDVEIIGLCFDLHASPINMVCSQNQEVRRDWKRKMYKQINDFFGLVNGEEFNDYFLNLTNNNKIVSVGKPHFVNALLSHPKVITWLKSRKSLVDIVRRKISTEKEAENEIDVVLVERTKRDLQKEYLFSLLHPPDEKPNSEVADEYRGALFLPKDFIQFPDGVNAIRDSGGVVVIPHAFVSAKKVGLNVKEFFKLFEAYFKEGRIVGIETEYPILPKYRKYYEKYGKGKRITRFIEPGKGDSGEYPTIEKDMTIQEMQLYANDDMETRVCELEAQLGMPSRTIVRLKVSDYHSGEAELLLRFCSGELEYQQLMDAKKKLTG